MWEIRPQVMNFINCLIPLWEAASGVKTPETIICDIIDKAADASEWWEDSCKVRFKRRNTSICFLTRALLECWPRRVKPHLYLDLCPKWHSCLGLPKCYIDEKYSSWWSVYNNFKPNGLTPFSLSRQSHRFLHKISVMPLAILIPYRSPAHYHPRPSYRTAIRSLVTPQVIWVWRQLYHLAYGQTVMVLRKGRWHG